MSAFITRAWLQNADNKFSAFASPTFISDATLEAINRSSTLREQMYSYANNANFDKVRLDPNSTAASFNFPDSDKQVKGFISTGANFFVSDFKAISVLAHELGHYAYEQPNAAVARARAAAYAGKDAVAYEQACHLTEGYANYNVGVVLLEVAANGGDAAWAGSPADPNVAFVVKTFRDFIDPPGVVPLSANESIAAAAYALGERNKEANPSISTGEDYREYCRRTSREILNLAPGAAAAGVRSEGVIKSSVANGQASTFIDETYASGQAVAFDALQDNFADTSTTAVSSTVTAGDLILGNAKDNTLDGGPGQGSDVLAGGIGFDTFTGGSKADTFLAGAGNDELNGGAGNDLLYGGAGTDTYNFTDAFGKDTIIDSDGLGQIKIGGKEVGTAKGAGKRGVWVADLGGGDFAWLAVYDDASSSTGKKLIITRASDADNTITINNFNLAKAEGNESYLGIKLDPTQRIAIVQGTGISVGASKPNVWADNNFNATSLDGKSSNVNEGAGKSFNIYLAQGAKAGAQGRRRVSLKSGDKRYQTRSSLRMFSEGCVPIRRSEGCVPIRRIKCRALRVSNESVGRVIMNCEMCA